MLESGFRYRCSGCGNLTRFDEIATRRTRRFMHFDLSGALQIEDEEILQESELLVTCRWCGPAAAVETIPALDTHG